MKLGLMYSPCSLVQINNSDRVPVLKVMPSSHQSIVEMCGGELTNLLWESKTSCQIVNGTFYIVKKKYSFELWTQTLWVGLPLLKKLICFFTFCSFLVMTQSSDCQYCSCVTSNPVVCWQTTFLNSLFWFVSFRNVRFDHVAYLAWCQ